MKSEMKSKASNLCLLASFSHQFDFPKKQGDCGALDLMCGRDLPCL